VGIFAGSAQRRRIFRRRTRQGEGGLGGAALSIHSKKKTGSQNSRRIRRETRRVGCKTILAVNPELIGEGTDKHGF